MACRTGVPGLWRDDVSRAVWPGLALRQRGVPQASLPDCRDDLPGHPHSVDGLVRRRLVHDCRPGRCLGVDDAEAAGTGLVPDGVGDAAPRSWSSRWSWSNPRVTAEPG